MEYTPLEVRPCVTYSLQEKGVGVGAGVGGDVGSGVGACDGVFEMDPTSSSSIRWTLPNAIFRYVMRFVPLMLSVQSTSIGG